MEHNVAQNSPEWHRLRKGLLLTASRFGDAVNAGVGSPGAFLAHLHEEAEDGEAEAPPDVQLRYMRHGTAAEPIVREMYELLSGHTVRFCGLFTPRPGHHLHGLVGASPDGVVEACGAQQPRFLVEIKAPVHRMYSTLEHPYGGIPLRYMCQMQGQMAVSEITSWCDFVTVCFAEQQLRVQRVYFSQAFWRTLEQRLLRFLGALTHGLDLEALQRISVHDRTPWPEVTVEERAWRRTDGRFEGDAGRPLAWSFLTGGWEPEPF